MPTADRIQRYIQELPEEYQLELLQFAESLWRRSRHNGSSDARGRVLAEILERLATHPTRVTEEDPVEWQRAERQDRDLPAR